MKISTVLYAMAAAAGSSASLSEVLRSAADLLEVQETELGICSDEIVNAQRRYAELLEANQILRNRIDRLESDRAHSEARIKNLHVAIGTTNAAPSRTELEVHKRNKPKAVRAYMERTGLSLWSAKSILEAAAEEHTEADVSPQPSN